MPLRRLAVLALAVPLLGGCALLRVGNGVCESSCVPSGTVVAVIDVRDGEATWPSDLIPPGTYDVTWAATCDVSVSLQGESLFETQGDGRSGRATVTFRPDHYGSSMWQLGCDDDDTVTVEVIQP